METVSRDMYNAMADDALIEACIGPTLRCIMGKSLTDKIRLTGGLTDGQRALLLFRMIQGHSDGGTLALFYQLSYVLNHKGVWMEFKKALKSFADKDLGQLADRLEKAYIEMTADGSTLDDWPNWGASPDMSAVLGPLDRDLRELMPGFVQSVAACIRRQPEKYIKVTD